MTKRALRLLIRRTILENLSINRRNSTSWRGWTSGENNVKEEEEEETDSDEE